MRIGVDFDGTLASWGSAMARWLREHESRELRPDVHVAEQVSPHVLDALVTDLLGSEWTLAMEPMPGAIEAMRRLGRRHALYIVTARDSAEAEWAGRWLQRHQVEVDHVAFTGRGPKVAVCRRLELDVLVDDNPVELEEIARTDTVAALLAAPEGAVPWGPRVDNLAPEVRRVGHWRDFERLCQALADGVERVS